MTCLIIVATNVPDRDLTPDSQQLIHQKVQACMLIATVSETQQQVMMGTFFFYLPALLRNGFMFPIANMPMVLKWLRYLNTLRHFLIVGLPWETRIALALTWSPV